MHVIMQAILISMLVTPIAAVYLSTRNRQLMAPAVGAFDGVSTVRGDASLRGAAVGWGSLAPLVRLEARRLFRHPAPYLVALPLCALSLSTLLYSTVLVYERSDVDLIILLVPYAWGTLIAANLLTLRSRRWRSEELLATTPTPQRSRTLAHLIANVVVVPGALLLLGIALGLGALSGRTFGVPRPGVVAAALLIVVGAGCVGVAVARWLPRPVFGWIAVIATIVLQVNFGALDPRWRWLHFSMYGNESLYYPELSPDHHLTHAVYLVGGILLVAAVAMARDGVDRAAGSVAGVALALLVVTGVVQARPASSDEAALLAQRLQQPGADQICQGKERFTLCAEAAYAFLVPHWSEPVAGVLRRVPAGAVPDDFVIRQRPTIEARWNLPVEVAERVDPTQAWPDDAEVSVSKHWALPAPEDANDPGRVQLSLGFRVASSLVGLPPDAWWSRPSTGDASWVAVPLVEPETRRPVASPLAQCLAGGEARAVVATWLAGQSTPASRTDLRRRAGEVVGWGLLDVPVTFDANGSYVAELPSDIPEQGSLVQGADIVAAVALFERPDDEVAAVLAEHWGEITGGDGTVASAAELLAWFGTDLEGARRIVAPTAPPPDPDSDPEDVPETPAVAGECPTSRPKVATP